MDLVKTIFRVLLVVMALRGIHGNGCANTETHNNTVINMCEQIEMVLGRVFISVTTVEMGSSTRCSCTLRSRTPGMTTSSAFYLLSNDSHVSKCDQSQIHVNPFLRISKDDLENFTCTSPLDSRSYTGNTTSNVTITLTRPDTSVGVSYCVLVQPDRWLANDTVLSCQSDVTQSGITPTSSSTSSTVSPTSTHPPQPAITSTPSLPTFTPLSVSFDASQMSSTESARVGIFTGDPSSVTIGAIVGGVLAGLVLICLTVVVSVYICCRYMTRRSTETQTGADNSAYTSLSDVSRVSPRADPNYAVIQSEGSSSPSGGNDETSATGVYEAVEAGSDVNRASKGRGDYYNV